MLLVVNVCLLTCARAEKPAMQLDEILAVVFVALSLMIRHKALNRSTEGIV